jgi:hypothetical protein
MATHHAAMVLDADGRRGLAVLTRQGEQELRRSLQNALRFALSVHLARRGQGLLLHSAALEVAGQAVLLVGPSGAGKTTALDLAAPCAPLADDVALVTARAAGAGWTLHETALWAEPRRRRPEAAGAVLRVGLVLALERGAGATLAPMRAAAGAALVAAHAPFLSHAAGVEPALPELALALAGAVPTARLTFGRDAALAPTLEKALAAARPGHARSEAP